MTHKIKIFKHLFFLIAIIALAAIQSGCMKEDYSDCPKNGVIKVKVFFTKHNDGNIDLFEKEVTKVDMFFFNKKGTLVSHIIDTNGPFVNGYTKEVKLIEGEYNVVVWANLFEDTKIEGINVDEICYDKARLNVVTEEINKNLVVRNIPTTLFHSEVAFTVKNGGEILVDAPLTLDTKNINISVNFQKRDGTTCPKEEHTEPLKTFIKAQNGQYRFDNSLTNLNWITYLEHNALPWTGSIEKEPLYRCTFRTHRLIVGAKDLLTINIHHNDNTENPIYERSLVALIQLLSQYASQDALDRERTFNIDINITCETHMVGSIYINGWLVVEYGEDVH
ncbi:MAG: FimB/Mfa2 family fimbrial subunit [Muribaculaceae bacterium]